MMTKKRGVGRPRTAGPRDSFTIEYPAELRLKERLDALAAKLYRSKTAEAVAALVEYLERREAEEEGKA